MSEHSERSLREMAAELHESLESADQLDDEHRRELREAVDEIRSALDDAGSTKDAISPTLGDRLQASIERFEEEHPSLTQLIGRVSNALADLGI